MLMRGDGFLMHRWRLLSKWLSWRRRWWWQWSWRYERLHNTPLNSYWHLFNNSQTLNLMTFTTNGMILKRKKTMTMTRRGGTNNPALDLHSSSINCIPCTSHITLSINHRFTGTSWTGKENQTFIHRKEWYGLNAEMEQVWALPCSIICEKEYVQGYAMLCEKQQTTMMSVHYSEILG